MLEREHRDASATSEASRRPRRGYPPSGPSSSVCGPPMTQRWNGRKQQAAGEAASRSNSFFSPQLRDEEVARFGAEEKSHRRRAASLQARMDRLQGGAQAIRARLLRRARRLTMARRQSAAMASRYSRASTPSGAPASSMPRPHCPPPGPARSRGSDATTQRWRGSRDMDAGSTSNSMPQVSGSPGLRSIASWRCVRNWAEPTGRCHRRRSVAGTSRAAEGRQDFDRTLEQGMRDGGHTMPSSRSKPSQLDSWQQEGRAARAGRQARTSERGRGSRRDARRARGGRAAQTPARQGSPLTGRAVSLAGSVSCRPARLPAASLWSRYLWRGEGHWWSRYCSALDGLVHGRHSRGNGAGVEAGGVSALAQREIPPEYLRLYQQAARRYGLDWAILAGIGRVECDHGRDPDPSCTHAGAVNAAGAGGPMQFLASTWATYGVDADGSGTADRWDAADAIYGAANDLRASGAPNDYRAAIYAYNHAGWYVDRGRGVGRQISRAHRVRPKLARGRRSERWIGRGRRPRPRPGRREPDARAVRGGRTRGALARRRPPRAGAGRRAGHGAGNGGRGQRAAGTALRSGRSPRPAGSV